MRGLPPYFFIKAKKRRMKGNLYQWLMKAILLWIIHCWSESMKERHIPHIRLILVIFMWFHLLLQLDYYAWLRLIECAIIVTDYISQSRKLTLFNATFNANYCRLSNWKIFLPAKKYKTLSLYARSYECQVERKASKKAFLTRFFEVFEGQIGVFEG